MATVTKGRTFVSGETVTPAKLNELVDNATVTSIVDADVSASAAIALSKLAAGALPTAITTTTGNLVDASVTQAKLASNVATTGPAFRAYATASTTGFTFDVIRKVNLAGEDFDTANCFASSRFTPNVAGYYFVSAGIRWEAMVNAQALLVKNGNIVTAGTVANTGTYQTNVSDLIYMNGTTDWIELHGVHYAAGTQSTGTASQANTWMSGFLARAA